jgi:serine/threonine-protein kinase
MQTPPANLYEFGAFQLDPAKRLLRRLDGTPVPLTPRVFDTLLYMVEHHDNVLDKERIMEAVWPDSIVEENNLAQAIWKLRQVFGETPGSHSYIVTVPGRGYRFVAEVNERTATLKTPQDTDVGTGHATISTEAERLTTEASDQKAAFKSRGNRVEEPYPRPAARRPAFAGKKVFGVGVAAIAIVALAALFLVHYRSLPANARTPSLSTNAGTGLSASARIPEKSIAVLPFENRSRDPDNAFFTDGVQDEILTDLARIADLKVISRTSVMQYKTDAKRNLRQIGNELGVAHVVEGSVQRAGNRVRVNAQLIDARTDAHLWAQTYDRDLADVFDIQSDIAKAIADQLEAKLSATEKSAIEQPPTTDITAFDLYSHAKNLFLKAFARTDGQADLLQAADLLKQAVARDPSFFQAYCQLAFTEINIYGVLDHNPAYLAQAEAALQAAARLRPDAGETRLARARNLYWGYLDYDGALRELEIARQSLPGEHWIFSLKGYVERRQGRWEECIRDLKRATALDPRNFLTLQQLAITYQQLRRYAEEKLTLERILAFDPNDPGAKSPYAFVEFNSKADTRSLHELFDSLRDKNPAALSSIADDWLICAIAERDPAAARQALLALGENPAHLGPVADVRFNRPFMEGIIASLAKDDSKAQAAFTAARVEQEKTVQAQPSYGPALCVLGLIDAGLGRKEEALREGRRAIELLPVEKDATNGVAMIKYLAMIAAWVGERDLACEQLDIAIRRPNSLSYGQLELMPFWDPLRGDPRFEKIVEEAKKPL